MSRPQPFLGARRAPGRLLDPATVDEMWRLRGRIFDLQPHVDPKEDRLRFGRFVAGCQQVLLFTDAQGTLRGMTSFFWEPVPGGPEWMLMPEYGFFEPAFRGHPLFLRAGLPVLGRVLAAARGRPLTMAGIGYPRSMRSGARLLDPLWSLQDPGLPEGIRRVLLHLLRRFGGPHADLQRGTVPLPTVPEAPPPPERRGAFWARYEALNPMWSRGVGLAMAGHIGPRIVQRLGADLLRRRR